MVGLKLFSKSVSQMFDYYREWKGKRIYPFFTSGGQPGKTANDFKRLLEDKGALVGSSLSVPYKRNLPQRPVDEIIRWAEKNKCKE